jgi:hypothetical protein
MIIAGHTLEFDAQGRLRPWSAWTSALDLQMTL